MGRPKGSKNGVHGHGTNRRWQDGCRCDPCVAAHNENVLWFREYQRDRVKLHGLPATKRKEMKSGGCEACGSYFRLAIDHDHKHCPGRYGCEECVRGVLCSPCNRALGYVDDDPDRLIALAAYITRTKRAESSAS